MLAQGQAAEAVGAGLALVTAVQQQAGQVGRAEQQAGAQEAQERAQGALRHQTRGQPAGQQLGPSVGLTAGPQRARERLLAL